MHVPVSDHYDKLLGPVYSWMSGGLDAALAQADQELTAVGLPRTAAGLAVDLGAGFGRHALPLARRGYSVVAIDGCEPLLQELKSGAAGLDVRAVRGDLLDFRMHVSRAAEVILCMGDTITHLPDGPAVITLFAAAAACLRPGGLFVLTFRDYASTELHGDGRFIPVRADENRILTCFLEYSREIVRVHDVLHERMPDGWHVRVSSYPKLRLSVESVVRPLTSLGFSVRREPGLGGMVRIVARR